MIPMTPALAAQIDETERLSGPRGDSMQVSRDVGKLLAAFALTLNAKTIVEVGTSYGFSGLWWSAALARTGGHLHTIDILDKKYTTAKAAFAAAGVSDRVTSYLGNGSDVVGKIDGPIDLVFIDADKPASQAYFDALWPKVRIGGGVLTQRSLASRGNGPLRAGPARPHRRAQRDDPDPRRHAVDGEAAINPRFGRYCRHGLARTACPSAR